MYSEISFFSTFPTQKVKFKSWYSFGKENQQNQSGRSNSAGNKNLTYSRIIQNTCSNFLAWWGRESINDSLRTCFRFDTHIFDPWKMIWCTLAASKRNFKQLRSSGEEFCNMKRIPLHVWHFLFSNESTYCCQCEFVCIESMSIRLCVK